jgi:hypothetical protein
MVVTRGPKIIRDINYEKTMEFGRNEGSLAIEKKIT